ncbi:hypothetical protein [Vogesella indigofera]|nr:hypothetical protein [Vogesella indigofera]MDC7712388.1 hypothetical protein [Vogesella indigofera]
MSILINSVADSRDKTAKFSQVQVATDSHPRSATQARGKTAIMLKQ